MKHTAYHRSVVNALKRDYGVSARIERGGNHPALVFHYHGQAQRVTLHNDGRESNTLALKLQDLRRTLGPPLRTNGHKPKRTMEDLMERLVQEAREAGHDNGPTTAPDYTKDCHAVGGMAGYRDRDHDGAPRLRFFIPAEIARPFMQRLGLTPPVRVSVQREGDNDWKILLDLGTKGKGLRLRVDGTRYAVDAGRSYADGFESFGTTPADYALIGTTIMVALKADQRRPVKLGNSQVIKRVKPTTAPFQPEPAPVAPKPQPQFAGTLPTEDEMQRALFTIRQVEERTPFRLTRLKDDRGQRWIFQARVE